MQCNEERKNKQFERARAHTVFIYLIIDVRDDGSPTFFAIDAVTEAWCINNRQT